MGGRVRRYCPRITALFVLAGVAALKNWFAVERDIRVLEYVAKPATTGFLLAAAVVGGADGWTIAALALCLAGDVFLMLPQDLFVPGLASFLLGHILFVVGFFDAHESTTYVPITFVLAIAALALSAKAVLEGAIAEDPALRIPVLAYMAVIGTMLAASAITENSWTVAGAIAFVTSDSILARNRFVREVPHGRLAIMVTYHAALALLVAGVV